MSRHVLNTGILRPFKGDVSDLSEEWLIENNLIILNGGVWMIEPWESDSGVNEFVRFFVDSDKNIQYITYATDDFNVQELIKETL